MLYGVLVDAGAGLILINKAYPKLHWICPIQRLNAPKPQTERKGSMKELGLILLIVKTETLQART